MKLAIVNRPKDGREKKGGKIQWARERESVCVCMCTCVCIYASVCGNARRSVRACVCVYMYVCACADVCMRACVHLTWSTAMTTMMKPRRISSTSMRGDLNLPDSRTMRGSPSSLLIYKVREGGEDFGLE